jgi:hypothetical protein
MSLNKLPNGTPSPTYKCAAIGRHCRTVKTVVLTEWWYDGKKVESIETSAENYFSDAFGKASFTTLGIVKEPEVCVI